MCSDPHDELPTDGESLDALLREARWPANTEPSVARLIQHWEKVWTARRRREIRMRRAAALALAASLLAAVSIGWLRFREKSITEVNVPVTSSPTRSGPALSPKPVITRSVPPEMPHHETRRPAVTAQTAEIAPANGKPTSTNRQTDLAPSRPPNELEELMLAAATRSRKRSVTSPTIAKQSPKRKVASDSFVHVPNKTRRKSSVAADATAAEAALVSTALNRLVSDSKIDVVKVGAELRTSAPKCENLLLGILSRGTRVQQIATLRLLAEIGSSASVGPLLRAAEEPQLHRASIEALARLADPSLVSDVVRMEPDRELRQTLMGGLLARGEPASLAEFLSYVENDRTADAALAAAQSVKKPPMDLLFSTLSQPLEAHRIAAARIIGRIDGAATTQRLITMVESGVNRHEACIALLSSHGQEATRYVSAAVQRDPTLAAILSGARLFTQFDNPPRS